MTTVAARPAGRRAPVRWIALGLIALLLFCVIWILVRALIARDELQGAVPLAQELRDSVISGEMGEFEEKVEELQSRATNAAALTSDPIWRLAEFIPLVGTNLTAFRESADVVAYIADGALPSMVDLADTFSLDSLGFVDGRIDLAPLAEAAPIVTEIDDVFSTAAGRVTAIDTASTVPQVGEAVDELSRVVTETGDLVGSLETAVSLLVPMLGADEPRQYLLLSLNNAELRATGGIPGALAILEVDDGAISLGETATARDFPRYERPVVEVNEDEALLFDDRVARFMQNITMTPEFERTAQFASEMWRLQKGQEIDGVVAIDPVALEYVLRVVGAVEAPGGVSIDGGTASSYLLNQVYLSTADPVAQDEFFESVTGLVMSALTEREYDKRSLVDALSLATAEGRLKVWSARSAEQDLLSSTPFSGALPADTDATSTFGVYLNDRTGAKIDYYLRMSVDVDSGACGVDDRPTFDVTTVLASTVPLDGAATLPSDITAGGFFGVEPGNIGTNFFVYAPNGSTPVGVTVDGLSVPFLSGVHAGRTVVSLYSELSPGEATQILVRFRGDPSSSLAVGLAHTPMSSAVSTVLNGYLDCGSPFPQ